MSDSKPDRLPRILVVDDDVDVHGFLTAVLERAGCVVRTTKDIWIIGTIESFKPDLILVDQKIGGSRGDKLIMALASMEAYRSLNMVIYSGLPEDKLRELAAESGAQGFICKTADRETTVRSILDYLPDRLS